MMATPTKEVDVSSWASAAAICAIARAGELIEFGRRGYTHWAVYVGGGYVVHVYLPAKTESSATIRRQRLGEVCRGDLCRINNLTGWAKKKGLVALEAQDIVRNAEKYLGQTISYNLLSDNCEFFATNCRYGKSFCQQIDTKSGILSSVAMVCGVIGVVAAAASSFLEYRQRNGDRVYEKSDKTVSNRNSTL